MSGADIIKTLIELLEAQEQIKITYVIKELAVDVRIVLPLSSSPLSLITYVILICS